MALARLFRCATRQQTFLIKTFQSLHNHLKHQLMWLPSLFTFFRLQRCSKPLATFFFFKLLFLTTSGAPNPNVFSKENITTHAKYTATSDASKPKVIQCIYCPLTNINVSPVNKQRPTFGSFDSTKTN
eukprot:190303_1